jgi:hypothetical protein
MLTKAEVNAVLEESRRMRRRFPELRQGQAFYNALSVSHRDISEHIRITSLDPFYDSAKLKACIEYLTKGEK